mgnify:CR=1 FL=1
MLKLNNDNNNNNNNNNIIINFINRINFEKTNLIYNEWSTTFHTNLNLTGKD